MAAISALRDNFEDNLNTAWMASSATGSGSVTEAGGQARCSLPSSTAGTHTAHFATSDRYDLTGGSFYWNIQTMVATGVAATAIMDLRVDDSNLLRWAQQLGTLTAQKIVAGVATTLYSVAWSATTYKYLRIRESGGNILFDSSTNGTTWTNRHTTSGLPIPVTALSVVFGASCGNVASPGSLRMDDVNLILPALSSTWRDTTVEWHLLNRFKSVTLASSTNGQAYLALASEATRKADGTPDVLTTPRYFAGPIGSVSGGYHGMTEYSTQAAAQAMAIDIPANDRWELPELVEARFIRLYHRSTNGAVYRIDEYYPRRLVQSDDIEAESIKAINIAAGAITADKIFVLNLEAVSAQMGALHMDGVIDIAATGGIYQGTGSFAAPTTGLKLWNSGGVGKLSGYNATVEQITLDTDGKLKAGAGVVVLDANGVGITGPTFSYGLYNASPVTTPRVNMIQWSKSSGSQAASIIGSASSQLLMLADKITLAIPLSASDNYGLNLQASGAHSMTADIFTINFGGSTGPNALSVQTNASNGGTTTVHGGLNVGSATGAGVGEVKIGASSSPLVTINTTSGANKRAKIQLTQSGTAQFELGADYNQNNTRDFYLYDVVSSALRFYIGSGGATGFFGSTGTTKPTVTGSRGANAALASLLTALANLGLLTDSST